VIDTDNIKSELDLKPTRKQARSETLPVIDVDDIKSEPDYEWERSADSDDEIIIFKHLVYASNPISQNSHLNSLVFWTILGSRSNCFEEETSQDES
jgi:hypothetical protein